MHLTFRDPGVVMAMVKERALRKYRRLPRTIAAAIIVGFLLIATVSYVSRLRERRAVYLALGAKYSTLAEDYIKRSQDDLESVQFGEESGPDFDKMLRNAEADGSGAEAAGVREMIAANQRDNDRLRAQARKWTEVSEYYRSLSERYKIGAERPWVLVESPDGDLLDVEYMFLKDQEGVRTE